MEQWEAHASCTSSICFSGQQEKHRLYPGPYTVQWIHVHNIYCTALCYTIKVTILTVQSQQWFVHFAVFRKHPEHVRLQITFTSAIQASIDELCMSHMHSYCTSEEFESKSCNRLVIMCRASHPTAAGIGPSSPVTRMKASALENEQILVLALVLSTYVL